MVKQDLDLGLDLLVHLWTDPHIQASATMTSYLPMQSSILHWFIFVGIGSTFLCRQSIIKTGWAAAGERSLKKNYQNFPLSVVTGLGAINPNQLRKGRGEI